jgi:hypothetical protein
MPIFNSLAKIVAKPVPKVVSPKAHAIVDYVTIGVFLGTVPLFWRRNKRATVASLICGGAELAVVLLTDYPGGVKNFISFRAHRELDYGLAALVATMPESLGFKSDREARFFRFQGALITLLGELTQSQTPVRARRSGRAA